MTNHGGGSCCLAGSKWRGHLLFFNRPPNVGIIHWISPCDERIVHWNQSEPTADSRLLVTRTTYVKSWNPSDSANCCMLEALSPPRVIHWKVVCTELIMTPNRYIHCVSILNFGETKIMYRRKQSTHHRLRWSQTKGGLFNRGACSIHWSWRSQTKGIL